MNTTSRQGRLCSCLLSAASAVLALGLCASASAEPSGKNVVVTRAVQPAAQQKHVTKYYVFSSASAIPLPVEQLSGPFPTTTHAMQVIGRHPDLSR